MKPVLKHRWDLTPREAIVLQRKLATRVRPTGRAPAGPYLVAGLDISGSGRWARGDERLVAGVIVFSHPERHIVECHAIERPSTFPYVPGLLSFREVPVYAELLSSLQHEPDLLLCDGQGIAHPRRFGLAAHLGVLFDVASIGVAKSRLCGEYDAPGVARGSRSPLRAGEEVIGTVLRTRAGVKPLFVSVGHRINLAAAAGRVLELAPRYRLPEPTRMADRWVGRLRRGIDRLPEKPRLGQPPGW